MTIKNFRAYLPKKIFDKGNEICKSKNIGEIIISEDGIVSALVQGSHVYNTSIKISGNGEISDISCTCPYEYGNYCEHAAALLIKTSKIFEKKIADGSSSQTSGLISKYCQLADDSINANLPDEMKVHIVPELRMGYDGLEYTLKIGRTRMYVVTDIYDLKRNIEYNYSHKYGKELNFVHSYDAFDEKSVKLIDLSFFIYGTDSYYSTKKSFPLVSTNIDSFFELYKDDYVNFDGRTFAVKYENPEITVKINEELTGRYSVEIKSQLIFVGKGKRSCFLSIYNNAFYLSSPEFSRNVYEFLKAFGREKKIYISKNDMQAFYTAIIKPLSQFIKFTGLEKLESYIPPEIVCSLYLDCNEDGDVCAKAEYSYGESIFPAFYVQKNNPVCDYAAEKKFHTYLLKYFKIVENDEVHPLVVSNENDIYNLLAEGIPELSKIMEIYASERFNRISMRSHVKPSVGIRPGAGSLLELEITADGYTPEELISLLSAYRKGKKYHRLKDGSFAFLDSSFGELAEITENLNITDKALLKEKIKIPKYRMLYLDSLKNDNENLRIKRSRDFKETVRNYHNAVEDSESSAVPAEMDDIMREYQKYGYRWMKTISAYGFGGVLADDMGLGKTIQAISLMLEAKENSDTHKVNMVVCPSSLTLNWENEIKKFAPQLKTAVIVGTAANRNKFFNDDSQNIEDYDVVITSYSLITRDIVKYEDIKFNIQFIDEAQYIKNHSTQAAKAVKGIHSEIRFALTGTPVENSLAELWSIFDFIMPDYLFNYTHFKKHFETPIVSQKEDAKVKALQKIVSPFILRRLKKDVLTELPDKTETILYADMDDEQSKLYSANVAEVKQSLGSGMNGSTERIKILAMLTRLRQICCDPSLVYENYKGQSGKLEQCLELIESCINSGHKILLFSQFTSMLDIIEKRLKKMDISSYMLTGKTKPAERIRLVNNFNKDDTKVFLISLKAGGTGLNLTGADIVIHYDPWWNVSAENQASDRAYRIGQKRNVQIYKLIANQTIEENIRRLQESKAELLDIAVNGDGDIMHMSADDIMSILE